MIYDAFKIAKHLNISKVTAYAKMKLPEVKPFLISHNGKTCVEEKGLEAIKQALKYNHSSEAESEVAVTVVNLLKEDMIEILKSNIEFIKQQLTVKDGQLYDINKLLENTQVLFKQEQEKNKIVLSLPETIKEHDIQLVNNLTQSLERQRSKAVADEILHRKKGIFQRLFDK
ncbi:hypothetical protein K2F40_03705 [Clostridium sp. CM028]|uniref:hypothetical protein n=1 Tax=unclassified Clostridium TaxID=2614128 RepID=UPI001C0C29BD|nr:MULTISPECIES: hypothetical protein [unclassified Clostridium]MBU3092425.1 hypothetical protein [Clostridium sp. CF011]MBW9146893.1 hypothetical protein [Clostridium sp. CM027]MBW9148083.1 hypothetical protein [Clostridium sp. CM028]UVE40840.1 hypothetical protein KTC92_17480 [Clostridium sp. CM027]WAG69823.1 hypothetical protein LL036_17960 [Clostridium sp. CF011]